MKQRRGIRRFVISASIFLLLGAMVNIAVAWGCAITAPQRDVTFDYTRRLSAQELDALFIRCARDEWLGHNEDIGTCRLSRHSTLQRAVGALQAAERLGLAYGIDEERFGLPLRTLRKVARRAFGTPGNGTTEEGLYSVAWKSIELPTYPIIPGFAINTLFYAAILWLLFALPGALRRWRRNQRGLCPACAYPVGTSDLCTECGKPVPVRCCRTGQVNST